jgi:hypothetical protein
MEPFRLEIVATGAFFVGFAINSARLASDGYARIRELHAHLSAEEAGWSLPEVRVVKWYSDDELYSMPIPTLLISQESEPIASRLSDACSDLSLVGITRHLIGKARFDFTDYGVGVASIRIEVVFPPQTSLASARERSTPLISRLEAALDGVLGERIHHLRTACVTTLPDYLLEQPWCQDDGLPPPPPSDTPVGRTEPGHLVWFIATIYSQPRPRCCTTPKSRPPQHSFPVSIAAWTTRHSRSCPASPRAR